MAKIITNLEVLRRPNEPATLEEAKDIIKQLEESLATSKIPGVGLAAPQIGINKKVCIIRIKKEDFQSNLDLVNPVVLEKHHPFINKGEGCLSLPGVSVDTQRYKEILVKDDLHPAGMIITGFEAVVVQHEFDHLESILMIDRAVGKNKVGRNDPCPCGKKINGKPVKYKKCHGKS